MSEDTVFMDGETAYGGSAGRHGSSFNEIMYRQLERITRLASLEFRGGYVQTRPISLSGSTVVLQEYVQDTGEAYCNAICVLFDLLFAYFDDEMIKSAEAFDELYTKLPEAGHKDYRVEKVNLHRELLRYLNTFLRRNNYLQMTRYEE